MYGQFTIDIYHISLMCPIVHDNRQVKHLTCI